MKVGSAKYCKTGKNGVESGDLKILLDLSEFELFIKLVSDC